MTSPLSEGPTTPAVGDLVANLTLMYTEHPLLERPTVARRAGFELVEFWWPFAASARPAPAEVDAFTRAIDTAGVRLAHMNLFGGDMAAGERGVLSHPERRSDFRDSLHAARTVAQRLGTTVFNVPYGHRRPGADIQLADETAVDNLREATSEIGETGGTVLLEAVSGMQQYPIKTTEQAVAIIDRVRDVTGVGNLGYLLDQYHLVRNGEDVFDSVQTYSDYIRHVQIADTPDRHEPGSGEFDFARWLPHLRSLGYTGPLALEFNPPRSTSEAVDAVKTWAGRLTAQTRHPVSET